MNWTLVAVIVILLACAVGGMRTGIIKMILSLVFSVVGIVVAIIITPGITDYAREHTDWDEKIRERTYSYMEETGLFLTEEDAQPEKVLPKMFQDKIDEEASGYLEKGIDAYNNFLVEKVTNILLSASVYVLTFVCVMAICILIGIFILAIAKLPVVRTVNGFAGMLIGLTIGYLIVSVLFLVVMLFINLEWGQAVYAQIDRNGFLSFIYERNVLLLVLSKIF